MILRDASLLFKIVPTDQGRAEIRGQEVRFVYHIRLDRTAPYRHLIVLADDVPFPMIGVDRDGKLWPVYQTDSYAGTFLDEFRRLEHEPPRSLEDLEAILRSGEEG